MTDDDSKIDLLTVASIAIVVYGLANFLHEGGGHGLACLLVGGKPLVLSSVHFDGDTSGLASWANRVVAAAGTLANFAGVLVALTALHLSQSMSARTGYFLWLFVVVNLLQGTGYFLFSGIANIGDWAAVIEGLPNSLLWHIGLAAVGGVSYWFSVQFAFKSLSPFLGSDPSRRYRRAKTLALVPYFTGGALYVLSGIFNPVGMILVAISAVAASFGGTSGLAWGPQLVRSARTTEMKGEGVGIERSPGWIVAAAIIMVLYVAILGPGIRLS